MQIVTVKPGNKPDLIAGHFFNEQTMVEDSLKYVKELEEALGTVKDIPITVTARQASKDEVILFFAFFAPLQGKNDDLFDPKGCMYLPPSLVVDMIERAADKS